MDVREIRKALRDGRRVYSTQFTAPAPRWPKALKPLGIDFVFIDGAHTYDYVLNDSRKAIDLLRGGKGIILWHDYADWFYVRKAINYLRTTDPRFANIRSIPGTSFACLICE